MYDFIVNSTSVYTFANFKKKLTEFTDM